MGISIHAPAEGATTAVHRAGGIIRISIHAPAEGATVRSGVIRHKDSISIHAPAEGATVPHFLCVFHVSNFNPRSRGGSDRFSSYFAPAEKISIHAPAEGATKVQCLLRRS